MIFHKNPLLLADHTHEVSYLIFFEIRKDVAKFVICCSFTSWCCLAADNHCKQLGPSSGPMDPKLFDTLKVFLKEFFEKVNFDKSEHKTKTLENYPACKELRNVSLFA